MKRFVKLFESVLRPVVERNVNEWIQNHSVEVVAIDVSTGERKGETLYLVKVEYLAENSVE